MTLTRRSLLAAAPAVLRARAPRRPRILLRGSWQSVNIGDIGHTPGALSTLARFVPEADITLWPGRLGHGSREFLQRHFPSLTIAEGSLGPDGKPDTPALTEAWAAASLYLSGSGSGFPAANHALAFQDATGKPVGVFPVSNDPISGLAPNQDPEGGTLDDLRARALRLPPTHLPANLRSVIDRAAFFFCRDTITLDYLRAQAVKTPTLEFGPDSQLGMTARDDARALAYLQAHQLTAGNFLCVVPRLRYTPYYLVNNTPRVPSDDLRDAINNRTVESDHARLRELIIRYVRRTGHRVLTCPEMTYQVELAKKVLVDPLPEDVRAKVVWRDSYWLPDEAASIYARALAVVSIECHSPLIALQAGTPAFHLRQPTDTCKGQMYRDFGASSWLFEIDAATPDLLWDRLQAIVREPAVAKKQVRQIQSNVEARQRRMANAVRAACGLEPLA